MTDQRPDPEMLVQRAQEEARQEKRAKLKIYLGAAPGVGKTYTMLQDALAKRAQGLDVVIGVVESHNREEIKTLSTGLEIMKRLIIDYQGRQLQEFDLDAALKRNPALILIDEMAHTNPSGLRHAKRWQDIKEILYHGIDVYTTLNVQHIDSLNDVVAKITQIHVKETVPDSMLELANTIELVDLPPEDLLKRLQEGKIYLPEQIELAKENYFRKGNLIALRELALRETAARVETEIVLYRKDQGIKQIWQTNEKILVCVGSGTESIWLIRAAKRMTMNMQANSLQKIEWIAVHVDAPQLQLSEKQRNNTIQNLHLAEQLGAQTRTLIGSNIVKEIIDFCHEQNITQIVLRKKIRPRWKDFLFRSLADEIIRNSDDIDVYIITGDMTGSEPPKPKLKEHNFSWKTYMAAVAIVSLATVTNFLFYTVLGASNAIMVYLLGITFVALFSRVGPSILASLLSVLAFDFFFMKPIDSFFIADVEQYFTLAMMLVVSQMTSYLIILARRQMDAAHRSKNYTAALHALSRQLISAQTLDELLKIGTDYIAKLFHSKVLVLLPEDKHLIVWNPSTVEQKLTNKEHAIAEWVYEREQIAGLGTETLADSSALYLPMLVAHGAVGVLRVQSIQDDALFTPEHKHLLEDCANQIALALEVDRLQERSKILQLKTEADRVRSIFMNAISHDLCAPSQVVMQTANALMATGNHLDLHEIKKMGKDIYSELEQLSHLTDNILQTTYLEIKSIKSDKKGDEK